MMRATGKTAKKGGKNTSKQAKARAERKLAHAVLPAGRGVPGKHAMDVRKRAKAKAEANARSRR